jgi:hypothetical protein
VILHEEDYLVFHHHYTPRNHLGPMEVLARDLLHIQEHLLMVEMVFDRMDRMSRLEMVL